VGRFAQLREKAQVRTGHQFPTIVILEAAPTDSGLIAYYRRAGLKARLSLTVRSRHAPQSACEGRQDRRESLVRTLLVYKRGEPRVCAMVKVPKPEEKTADASAASVRR
jgi:transposase